MAREAEGGGLNERTLEPATEPGIKKILERETGLMAEAVPFSPMAG